MATPNPARIKSRIEAARRRLEAKQSRQYEPRRRTGQATVTAIDRDPVTGHATGAITATIDGVSDTRVFVGYGSGISAGDVLRVENRGSAVAPDWTLIGKSSAAGGTEGMLDTARTLSTPAGLSLGSAVYTPSPGNLRSRITATWDQIGDWESVSHYEAQIRRDGDGSITATTTPHTNAATTAGISWSELEPGIAYSARVRAVGFSGATSGWTSWSSINAAADTTAPATPTGLSATQITPWQLRATWTANTEPDLWYYEIGVSPDNGSTQISGYPRTAGDRPEYQIATQPGAARYFRLKAWDTSGNGSAWSSWAGPYATSEAITDAGLIYLAPRLDLLADMTDVQTGITVGSNIFSSGEYANIIDADGTWEIVKFTSSATPGGGGYQYTITRAADGGTAYAHTAAGASVYWLGQSGYILVDTRDGGSSTPYLDVWEWDSPYTGTWGDQSRTARLGDLSGISDSDFGGSLTGHGLYTTNAYLKGAIQAGAGSIMIDDDGIDIDQGTGGVNQIKWTSSAQTVGSIWAYDVSDAFFLALASDPSRDASNGSQISLRSYQATAADDLRITMDANGIELDAGSGVISLQTGSTEAIRITSAQIMDFRGTMGNSSKDPTTDAPADWAEIQIAGTTYYVPAYAA